MPEKKPYGSGKRVIGRGLSALIAQWNKVGAFSATEFESFFEIHFGNFGQNLYHYTKQDALFSILKNRNVWCTHIQHLNDATEYEHAFDVLRGVIKKAMPESKGTQRSLLEHLATSVSSRFDANVFVLCFSDKHDDLNQWRSYASPGSGYCIGYLSSDLRKFAAYNNAKLGQCVYSRPKQEDIVKQLVSVFLDDIEGYFPFFGPAEINGDLVEKRTTLFWRYFQQIAPLFKHPAFSEEEEARIVIRLPRSSQDIEFRSGSMSIVPYTTLPAKVSDSGALSPVSVSVKPSLNVDFLVKSLDFFLEREGYGGTGTQASRIPFRDPAFR